MWTMSRKQDNVQSIALPLGALGIVVYKPRQIGNSPVSLKVSVFRSIDDMVVVVDMTTSGDSMKFFWCPQRFSVRSVWMIAGANWWKSGAWMMYLGYDILFSHAFQLGARVGQAVGLVSGVGVIGRVAEIIVRV
jgi:hypothetical protein